MSSFGLCFGRRSMKRLNRSRPTSIAGWSSTIPSVPIKAIATWADARSRLSCNTWKVFAKKVKNTDKLLRLTHPTPYQEPMLCQQLHDQVLRAGKELALSIAGRLYAVSPFIFSCKSGVWAEITEALREGVG